MKITQKYMNINPKVRSVIFITGLIVIGIIIGQFVSYLSSPYLLEEIQGQRDHHFPPFELTDDQKQDIINGYTRVSMILSTEIVLLCGLIYIFAQTYRKTRSSYLIGFVIFVGVFLLKSVSYFMAITPLFRDPIRAAPISIEPLLGGFFGPFGIYFNIFEIVAICILIYLSRE